jgi:hypothetical protein
MARPKGLPKTGGRRKGQPNKTTTALKDAILNAFSTAGGEAYLARIAAEDPRTFCTLLGKVLPMQVTGDADAPLQIAFKTVYETKDGD